MAVRTAMECHFDALPCTPFPASRDFPSRGNEGYEALDIVSHMTQKANPVTFLASSLGEEGHEVAKGCTRVILIMILDVDVTAAGVSKGEAAPFFYMTVCCSPTPSSRAEMHVGMGQMENALMIL